MKSIYTILRTLNDLLDNKENYNAADYERKLLDLMDEIDKQLLMKEYDRITEQEQEIIMQQVRRLLEME